MIKCCILLYKRYGDLDKYLLALKVVSINGWLMVVGRVNIVLMTTNKAKVVLSWLW